MRIIILFLIYFFKFTFYLSRQNLSLCWTKINMLFMENFEKVLKQQKVTYLKSKFVSKQVELFITDDELIFESNKITFRGPGLLKSIIKINFDQKNKEVIIPLLSIESVKGFSSINEINSIEILDKNGKDYRFEMKHHDEWVDLINSKIDTIAN